MGHGVFVLAASFSLKTQKHFDNVDTFCLIFLSQLKKI